MKYILLCTAALVVCVLAALVPAMLISRAKKLKRSTTLLLALLFGLILICAVCFGYLSVYYHADFEASAIKSETVQMEKIDGGYFFDGPCNDTALIFYPGAKVETLAYAPLMMSVAENGVDCFLADMPFHMAIFGSNAADKFINTYSYENWVAGGHSMGGLVISGYASNHADKIDSLILLASYPNTIIPDSIQLCSIYGTLDGCLNLEAYEQAKEYWPVNSVEEVLVGANHAQYADYGPQSGDFEASVSCEEQQTLTADIILELLKNN